MSVASAAECRMDAYVVRHRQSGRRVGQSEAVGAREPERLRVIGGVEVELLVLEADVDPVEDIEARARTPGEGAVTVIFAQAAEGRGNLRFDVVPVIAGLRKYLEPVPDGVGTNHV